MSLPVDEWKGKIQTQIAESQKILGHYESFCESKHVSNKLMTKAEKNLLCLDSIPRPPSGVTSTCAVDPR